MDFTKKLQFKGWSGRGFNEVRNAVERVFDAEDFSPHIKASPRNKCVRNKTPHNWVVTEVKEYDFAKVVFTVFVCDTCKKKKVSWKK